MDSASGEKIGNVEKAINILREIYDPEIPVDIYELGLIYDVRETAPGVLEVTMTLTAPSCPAAQSIPVEVESKLKTIAEIESVKVDIVWDPPWDPSRMSEAAKLALGMF